MIRFIAAPALRPANRQAGGGGLTRGIKLDHTSSSAGYWAAASAGDQFQLLPAAGVAAVMV
jgi:hypothetical protein